MQGPKVLKTMEIQVLELPLLDDYLPGEIHGYPRRFG
jgi:hypothetical protein